MQGSKRSEMKNCEKCGGKVIYEYDVYGEFYTCIMCGKTNDIRFSTLFGLGNQANGWGVQSRTKKK
jgi:DNA-directed RNA polymerase subunit RPC12/RpoP